MDALRWVLVLPGAIAAAYIAWFAVTLLNRLTMQPFVSPDGFLGRAYLETISNLVMGAATVYAGSRIAPRNQHRVAVALTVVVVLAAVILFLPAFHSRSWWAVYAIACLVVGASIISWLIYRRRYLAVPE